MRHRRMRSLMVVALLGTPTGLPAQRAAPSPAPCSTAIAAAATKETGIDAALIARLMRTGSPRCADNVEFMETFNEALFNCLDRNPSGFLREFGRAPNRDFLLKELESPVNDAIEPARILEKLERVAAIDRRSFERIRWSLMTAQGKR